MHSQPTNYHHHASPCITDGPIIRGNIAQSRTKLPVPTTQLEQSRLLLVGRLVSLLPYFDHRWYHGQFVVFLIHSCVIYGHVLLQTSKQHKHCFGTKMSIQSWGHTRETGESNSTNELKMYRKWERCVIDWFRHRCEY